MCEVNGRHPSLSQKEILEVFFWGVSQLMPRKENLDVRIDIYNIDDNVTGYHCKTDIHEIEIEKEFLTKYLESESENEEESDEDLEQNVAAYR